MMKVIEQGKYMILPIFDRVHSPELSERYPLGQLSMHPPRYRYFPDLQEVQLVVVTEQVKQVGSQTIQLIVFGSVIAVEGHVL